VDAHAGIDDRDRASLLDEITVAQSMSPINGAGRGSCFRVSSFVLRASGGRGWPWRMRTAARIGASTSVRPAARALTMRGTALRPACGKGVKSGHRRARRLDLHTVGAVELSEEA
jgi:hypothetical protein